MEGKCDQKDKENQTLESQKQAKIAAKGGGVLEDVPSLEVIETCSKRVKGICLKDETREAV